MYEERESVEEYKITCIEFIRDISNDYKDWVYRYRLDKEEEGWRLRMIDNVVKVTSSWISLYGDTIKKIDIIKDDGITKMAEFTAGYPFELNVYIADNVRYVEYSKDSEISLDVKASTGEGRSVGITYYDKRYMQLLNILSSSPVNLISYDSEKANSIDAKVRLDISNCVVSDIISVTVIVGEYMLEDEIDRRGFTTLIRLV
jgi:hypothetical protein